MFIDFARIKVESGRGGSGCVSFRREKFVAKGGPDGGDGGKGGNIIAVGNENINTLIAYRFNKLYKSERGEHGQGSNKTGACGEDKFLDFPLGTEIFDITDGKQEKIGEVLSHGQKIFLAKGGNVSKENTEWLGLKVESLNGDFVQKYKIDADKGVVITQIQEDTPAANSNLSIGDVIIEINQQPINDVADYKEIISQLKKNNAEIILFYVKAKNGTYRFVPVNLK